MPALRCPVCKAENAAGPSCRRCKADLSPLFDLEAEREWLLEDARRLAAEGRWRELLGVVEQAHRLRGDDETRKLRAVARLLNGDFEGAVRARSVSDG